MKRSLLFLFILISLKSFSQDLYPTHWWVGMNNPELQLIIHRQNVAHETVTLMKYKGVKVVRQHKMESPNYLLLDLEISKKAKPGKLEFKITNLQSPEAVSYKTFQYELKSRSTENGKTRVLGVNSSDFV
ncbi:MAG: cyclomaltodextrinase N-terminal domain-containing protein, partial [Chitinophagaceae bacterium]|nr:cyclomaltodextrinase N-terminal domain-containing protein [Chitinophagaceae bacterium]